MMIIYSSKEDEPLVFSFSLVRSQVSYSLTLDACIDIFWADTSLCAVLFVLLVLLQENKAILLFNTCTIYTA